MKDEDVTVYSVGGELLHVPSSALSVNVEIGFTCNDSS